MINRPLLGLVVCAALLAGCSGGESSPADTRQDGGRESPSTEEADSGRVSLDGEIRLEDVRALDLQSELHSEDLSTDDPVAALFDDGRMVTIEAAVTPDGSSSSELLVDGRAIPRIGSAEARVANVVADGSYVVWTETTVPELAPFPWVMYAFDTTSETTRMVARAPRVRNQDPPPPPGFSPPALVDGKVAWIQADGWPARDENPTFNLYAVDLDARTSPRRLATHAKFPAVTADGVYFARDHQVDPSMPAGDAAISHVQWNGRSERRVQRLQGTRQADVLGLAAASERITWIQSVDGTEAAVLANLEDETKLRLLNPPGGCLRYPVLTDAILVLPDGNCSGTLSYSAYVLIFGRHTLGTVGTEPGLYNLRAAGNELIVPIAGPDGRIVDRHFRVPD